MKVKTFNKGHCSRLVTLEIVGNMPGNYDCWDGKPILCTFLYMCDKMCTPSVVPSI